MECLKLHTRLHLLWVHQGISHFNKLYPLLILTYSLKCLNSCNKFNQQHYQLLPKEELVVNRGKAVDLHSSKRLFISLTLRTLMLHKERHFLTNLDNQTTFSRI